MTKEQLITAISDANAAYAAGIPFMPDSEYDQLWKQLYSIDPTNDLLYHTAQQKINLDNLIYHKYRVFGTNKAFNMLDLKPFMTRFGDQQLIIEPKYDGCAAVITITKNGLTITTEGDGKRGEDKTYIFRYIKNNFNLRHFQTVELLIPWADWQPTYGKNPRNVVAGWLARKYSEPETNITAIPHDFGPLQEHYRFNGNYDELSDLLLATYAKWSKIYPMDGLMLKVADERFRLVVGNNGQVNHWSIAWKPPIQTASTIVTDIEWNISRLGRIIPTVVYKPIELCSTINSRATGNNAQWIEERKIGIGSTILVGKAGEIIPKILEVQNVDNNNSIEIPEYCPKCNTRLHRDGVHLVCDGPKCITKLTVAVDYFYGNKGFKIDGIGQRVVEKLLNNQTLFDMLSDKPWALLDMLTYNIAMDVYKVLGQTMYENIIRQVEQINGTKTIADFISSLGLPGLGRKSSLRLCQYLKSGKLKLAVSKKTLDSFIRSVTIFDQAKTEMSNFNFAPLPAMAKAIYCITGTLSRTRDEMIAYLKEFDYEFSSSVTKETNYLIVGYEPGKTKINSAEKYHIPQITEEQFLKILLKEK